MKRIVCLIISVFLLIALCACNKEDNSLLKGYDKAESVTEYDFLSGSASAPENYTKYSQGITSFAFDLLSACVSEDENILVSPYSAATALSLLSNGASDSTRKELRNALSANLEVDDINACSYYLTSRLSAFNTEEAKLIFANSLWLDDSFDVKPSFLQSAVNYYDADVQRILFSEGNGAEKINQWVSDKTEGEITDATEEVSADAKALMVNVVFFDDEWATPYAEDNISAGVFYGSKGDEEVSYMTSTEHYISTAYAQGMTKGFKNLPLKMAVLMPTEDVSVDEFASELTGAKWETLLNSQESATFCKASVPEFEIRVKNDLKNPLMDLGVEKIFDKSKADFSALSNSGKVSVSSMTQDAFVKIGPKEVKAGASTVTETTPTSAPETTQQKELVFDRPFVFVIYDNESGVSVFTGVVNHIN